MMLWTYRVFLVALMSTISSSTRLIGMSVSNATALVSMLGMNRVPLNSMWPLLALIAGY